MRWPRLGLFFTQKGRGRVFSKSLIMPFGFAILAAAGLLFQLIAYLLETPVTLLQP
ncbi:hypothetical protein AMC82_CH02217 [Rhizobium phaseoli]|nr:hypothetical protein AMC86_CH02239 [Rhizobium phaseoli]ANL72246.1 hypothetical protein AMC83_CH02273 [Rhizobium phaseoli]ANL78678.1 hypothetical protein AMC82_CH02217 [Rhizobium phaseoli]ANL91530.1 hypothetical protein AMC80_CH02255 [Rhizobium phaseoli]ANM04291.1 hypothetical protein AMC78_CH02199 [Rhizobium phaseoli]